MRSLTLKSELTFIRYSEPFFFYLQTERFYYCCRFHEDIRAFKFVLRRRRRHCRSKKEQKNFIFLPMNLVIL